MSTYGSVQRAFHEPLPPMYSSVMRKVPEGIQPNLSGTWSVTSPLGIGGKRQTPITDPNFTTGYPRRTDHRAADATPGSAPEARAAPAIA